MKTNRPMEQKRKSVTKHTNTWTVIFNKVQSDSVEKGQSVPQMTLEQICTILKNMTFKPYSTLYTTLTQNGSQT